MDYLDKLSGATFFLLPKYPRERKVRKSKINNNGGQFQVDVLS